MDSPDIPGRMCNREHSAVPKAAADLAMTLRGVAGAIALFAAVPVSAQGAARITAGPPPRATIAVSLTVLDEAVPTAIEGDRFVSGRGARSAPCEGAEGCSATPPPKLVARGAANSGFRPAAEKPERAEAR